MKKTIIAALIFTASTFAMEEERGAIQETNVAQLYQFLSQEPGLILGSRSLHNSPNMKRNRNDEKISIDPCPVDNAPKSKR
ncbi:hypothetical protein HYX58_01995 [Candidatus Dependentiae bacterium]|nr:hypothetical protein [Candidatus Dependentiae bacterium]